MLFNSFRKELDDESLSFQPTNLRTAQARHNQQPRDRFLRASSCHQTGSAGRTGRGVAAGASRRVAPPLSVVSQGMAAPPSAFYRIDKIFPIRLRLNYLKT